MFEAGDKVVCIDDSPVLAKSGQPVKWAIQPTHELELHEIYVIREICTNPWTGNMCLRLLGMFGGVYVRECGFMWECAWKASRFRKLSEMQAEARQRQKQQQPG